MTVCRNRRWLSARTGRSRPSEVCASEEYPSSCSTLPGTSSLTRNPANKDIGTIPSTPSRIWPLTASMSTSSSTRSPICRVPAAACFTQLRSCPNTHHFESRPGRPPRTSRRALIEDNVLRTAVEQHAKHGSTVDSSFEVQAHNSHVGRGYGIQLQGVMARRASQLWDGSGQSVGGYSDRGSGQSNTDHTPRPHDCYKLATILLRIYNETRRITRHFWAWMFASIRALPYSTPLRSRLRELWEPVSELRA